VASWWSVGDFLVQPPRCVSVDCAGAFWWPLGGHVCASVFASYFIGVVVAFKPYFWWCMRGLLLVDVLLVLAWRFLVVSRRHVSAHMGAY
jgi:hypothetical protein